MFFGLMNKNRFLNLFLSCSLNTYCNVSCVILTGGGGGGRKKWLARSTRDSGVVGSNPTIDHVVIALGGQFTHIASFYLSVKWVLGNRQLKCIVVNGVDETRCGILSKPRRQ